MYTEEGNWDLVGNNIPVFFIQDAMKFPDLVHAVKEEQDRGWPQAASAHDTFWDFVSLMPESTHMLLWAMSDRAIPRSFRFMEGFGVHTYRFVNADGDDTFVKFHWKPRQGLQSVVWNEALKINGADPDFHRRDLYAAIESGDLPQWDLGVQVFDEAFADEFDFDVLDATKLIPEEVLPVRVIARLTLDRVVDNMFAENEQVAFGTHNVIPGIDFSNDPLLQGRNFSYLDTQLKRLGSTNFTQLPGQRPALPGHALPARRPHADRRRSAGRGNYEPNSLTGDDRGPRADVVQGYQSVMREEAGPDPAAAGGVVRRPLQPGPPVLPQPDRGRAGPHRRRLLLRARQGRGPEDPHPDARQPAQRPRGPRPGASPTSSRCRCPRPPRPRCRRAPTCPSRPRSASCSTAPSPSPAASSACW